MASCYAKLKGEWLLRGWTDVPWSLVNWRNGDYRLLEKDGFHVAQSCDGQTDFGSMAFLPRHIAWLNRFITAGIAEECQAGEPLEPVQKYRQAANPVIRGIQWAVTGRCNLRCRHCYMDAPAGQHGELSFSDMKRLISQFEEANISAVSLTGGEPFLREDLFDLIRLLAEKRIHLADIYSNGTLISDAWLKDLKDLGVRPVFRISFDGCGAHDRMRGMPGVEPLVLSAIHRIRAAGFDVAVTTSVDKTNVESLAATYERMKEFDLYAWGVARPQPVGCGRGLATGLSLEEMAGVCERLLRRWIEDGRPFMIGLEAFYSGAKGGAVNRAVPAPGNPTPDSYACPSCRQWPYLAPDGKILPCIGYTDTDWVDRLPNLLEIGLSGAWNDPALRSLLDIKKGDVLARNVECAGCEMFSQCGTGCRASALAGGGALLSKDPMACELWKGGFKRRFAEIADARERAR